MKIFDLFSRLRVKSVVRASENRIKQVGNSQKEQAYYNYFS